MESGFFFGIKFLGLNQAKTVNYSKFLEVQKNSQNKPWQSIGWVAIHPWVASRFLILPMVASKPFGRPMDFLGIFLGKLLGSKLGFSWKDSQGSVLAIWSCFWRHMCYRVEKNSHEISIGCRGWENQLIGPHCKDSVIKGGMSLSPKKRDF